MSTFTPSLLSSLVLAVAFVSCGAQTTCERINAAQESFFAGKTECTYTEGSSGLTLTRSGTCTDTTACTAAEIAVLDTYASCVGSAKVCSPGNEKQAATEMTACAFTAAAKVSASCSASIK